MEWGSYMILLNMYEILKNKEKVFKGKNINVLCFYVLGSCKRELVSLFYHRSKNRQPGDVTNYETDIKYPSKLAFYMFIGSWVLFLITTHIGG